jgi:hypothetical protein
MCEEGGVAANERGIVLYAALLILSLLMAIGVGAFISTQNNFKISSNLRGEQVAFYLAEAGIEWSKAEIGKATAHPPDSLEATRNFARGTFSVSTVNSILLSPLVAKSVVRSTGAFTRSSSVIQAQITKAYDLVDAALALRGNTARFNFTGDEFVISGMDYDPLTGATISGSNAYPGISVSEGALKRQIESELSSSQLENVTGTDRDGSRIGLSDFLPASSIARLADDLCSAPHAVVALIPSEGHLSVADQNWGNRASPQLRCIEGLSAEENSVHFNANFSGAGIMVVRNADLVLSGPYRWDGLIIVTGNNIALKVIGGDTKEIYGALMINEAGAYSESKPPSLDIQGTVRLLFSRFALENISPLVPMETMAGLYASLPFSITQNYWRIATP